MTTPNGPSEREHDEGKVRPLLWRLRARLVTPPDERRARTDLDRLFAIAREQAHDAPSRDASSRPGALGEPSSPSHPYDEAAVPDGDELVFAGSSPRVVEPTQPLTRMRIGSAPYPGVRAPHVWRGVAASAYPGVLAATLTQLELRPRCIVRRPASPWMRVRPV